MPPRGGGSPARRAGPRSGFRGSPSAARSDRSGPGRRAPGGGGPGPRGGGAGPAAPPRLGGGGTPPLGQPARVLPHAAPPLGIQQQVDGGLRQFPRIRLGED